MLKRKESGFGKFKVQDWSVQCGSKNKAKKSKSSSLKNHSNGGIQTFLDCGQRNLEKKTCSICDMTYSIGVQDDETQHNSFCKQFTFLIGSRFVIKPNFVVESMEENGIQILCLRKNDNKTKSLLARILEIKEKNVDVSMGFAPEDVDEDQSHDYWYFVAVSKNRHMAGILVIQRIGERFKLIRYDSDTDNTKTKPIAKLGVLQIWVHPEQRGKRLATKMLDVARQDSLYGVIVTPTELAFSQPTEEGLKLAKAYCKTEHPIVYKLL